MTTFTVKDFIEKLETLPLDTPVLFVRPCAIQEGGFVDDPEEAVKDWTEYLPAKQLDSPEKLAKGTPNPYFFERIFFSQEYKGIEVMLGARVENTRVRTQPFSEEELNELFESRPEFKKRWERMQKRRKKDQETSANTNQSLEGTPDV